MTVRPRGSASPVPSPRFATIVTTLTAPALIALGAGWWAGVLDMAGGLAASGLAIAGIAFLCHRHFAGLDALRLRIERLIARETEPSVEPLPVEIPATAAGLSQAIGELDHSWRRRDQELSALLLANETIFEAIPDPLLLIDPAHRIVRENAAARSLFGSSIRGRDLATVLRHPDVLDAAEEVFLHDAAMPLVEFDWQGAPTLHLSVRFARVPAGGDDARGTVLLVLRDVTSIRNAERMRADFVANVSHELRTPLAALVGFIETLRGPAREDVAARDRFLGIMNEQSQRMTRLVRDLLSLSRIEESEHTPPTDQVEVGRVLSSVVDTLMLQAKAKGSAIELDVPADLPAIAADADQLAQVFQNLLDNAIKYGKPSGRVRVVVRKAATAPTRVAAASGAGRAAESPAGWISVAIADDGEGIPREHLPRLTERFYRVDPARSRQLGGTGLGLAIVKHILNRHRGSIAIDSEPGHGSVFTAWLPVSPATTAPAH